MDTGDAAAARVDLLELATYVQEHPVTGPSGHSYISSAPRATRTSPVLPVNFGMQDHIQASVREVIDETLAVNPDAGLPDRLLGVYEWCIANTEDAPEGNQLRRDAVIYRQHLEHAIRLGNRSVIRPIRCPACRTLGLFWEPELGRALCTNKKHCRTKDGTSSTWSLGRLAWAKVMEQQKMRQASAT